MSGRIKIAIPVGDPAGIGPEISLKAALDPAVRAACEPILVCDEALLARHAKACGLDASKVDVLPCPQPETASLGLGVVSPIIIPLNQPAGTAAVQPASAVKKSA